MLDIVIDIVIEVSRLFGREKLGVCQTCLPLIAWLEPVLERLPESLSVRDQRDRLRA